MGISRKTGICVNIIILNFLCIGHAKCDGEQCNFLIKGSKRQLGVEIRVGEILSYDGRQGNFIFINRNRE